MQALLLSAGLGSRLKPLTHYFPKCLTPVQGHPLLGVWLQMLVTAGFKKIFVNIHYKPEMVLDFVNEAGFSEYVEWIVEPELLGTAGTIVKHREKFDSAPLLIVHADNYSRFSIESMWQAHVQATARIDITMMTFTTDTPQSCGVVEMNNNGQIIAFHEKVKNPPCSCANAAVYIVNWSIIEALPDATSDFTTQVIEQNLRSIQIWHNTDYHRDIGVIDSLLKVSNEFTLEPEGPVTQGWVHYWSANQWKNMYSLAEAIAEKQQIPLFDVENKLLHEAKVGVVTVKQFTMRERLYCVTPLSDQLIFIVGKGNVNTIDEVLRPLNIRYILLTANNK